MVAREPYSDGAVGFSLFRTVADESELLLLAVAPTHHRRGVGQRLLEAFLEQARNDGVTRVHLEVRDGNPAVSMYRNVGFRQSAGAGTIIMGSTESVLTRSHWPIDFS